MARGMQLGHCASPLDQLEPHLLDRRVALAKRFLRLCKLYL